ncbi:MAG: M48 family metalloprotease, partial [Planctomycetia bacterium]|nr:M48 family metalloprotease [Planctomycetia bacterium]
MRPRRNSIPALLLILPILALGCSINPVTGKKEFILISTEQEIAIGAEAAPEFEKEFGGKVPNQKLQSYVRAVGQKVSALSDRSMPYEFALLSSDVPNAFALPGGKIYITAGLMRRMTNERQLAAVLGHETGHVAAKHNVKGLQRQVGAAILVEVAVAILEGEAGQKAGKVTEIVTSLANLKYSREDEYLSDTLGIKYAAKAGYNPWGMVELLEVLRALSGADPRLFGDMFDSHPLTQKRVEQAKDIIR